MTPVSTEEFEATTGVSLMSWITANYGVNPEGTHFICRRCGQQVGWVTRHAVERHGDQIPIVTPINTDPAIAEEW